MKTKRRTETKPRLKLTCVTVSQSGSNRDEHIESVEGQKSCYRLDFFVVTNGIPTPVLSNLL